MTKNPGWMWCRDCGVWVRPGAGQGDRCLICHQLWVAGSYDQPKEAGEQ